ncbi:hypothetical protein ACFFF5_13565 [Lederbergia wuyishanensis]|uniref:Lipoprotein n=1 Tax=Lederbergia wuyishanensis TaxID=1347903 RepID=A0ABU0D4Z5_9BACI|nr:hypothetical protein [Lederbergia wuyishanensis]MCJ8009559.1 hypothetical protein [Lederbergia wuyishanensis]MDQ0343464.1 hypothetical protein [Lederbergia wuyishanensis]
MKKMIVSALIMFSVLIIAACGKSIDEEKVKAEANVEKVFQAKPEEANEEVQTIKFNLPTGFTIQDESPNNIILKKGDDTYILFYNPNETSDSKALYDGVVEHADKEVINKTFQKNERFGYLVINESEKELYEVTVGIGGIKATSESDLNHLAADAELLMKIVNSTMMQE